MRASALFAGAGGAPRELAFHASSPPLRLRRRLLRGQSPRKTRRAGKTERSPETLRRSGERSGRGFAACPLPFLSPKPTRVCACISPPFISKTDKSLPKPHTSRPLLKPPTLLHTAHRSPSMNVLQNAHLPHPTAARRANLRFTQARAPAASPQAFARAKPAQNTARRQTRALSRDASQKRRAERARVCACPLPFLSPKPARVCACISPIYQQNR